VCAWCGELGPPITQRPSERPQNGSQSQNGRRMVDDTTGPSRPQEQGERGVPAPELRLVEPEAVVGWLREQADTYHRLDHQQVALALYETATALHDAFYQPNKADA